MTDSDPQNSPLRRGAIAVCSRGQLGLITCDEPQQVTYPDGSFGLAWVGIHLSKEAGIGEPWSSRTPKCIGFLEDLPGADRYNCCGNIKAAKKDGVIIRDPVLGACLQIGEDRIPVTYCPWCGQDQARTLATSPAFLYRP